MRHFWKIRRSSHARSNRAPSTAGAATCLTASMLAMPGVTFQQTVVPSYRLDFFRQLGEDLGGLRILAGAEFFDPSTTTDPAAPSVGALLVVNVFLARRRVLWQRRVLRRLLTADVAVLELNPRILTNWLVLLGRGILCRPVLVWGHASSRDADGLGQRLRSAMVRSASAAVAYTDRDRVALERMSRHRVYTAPNALYGADQMHPPHATDETPRDFIVSGRLVAAKRPSVALRAFELAAPSLLSGERLVFIGDGPEADALRRGVDAARLTDRVKFVGHEFDYQALRRLYASAIATISPGYVGLSVTQSLGFGVPVFASRDEVHSPEVEALQVGFNGGFFETDSPERLAALMVTLSTTSAAWRQRRTAIADDCRSHYSLEAMAAGMTRALCHCGVVPVRMTVS